MPDDHSESVPPLPIPNRTVKRLHADDSADCPCESRSSSGSPAAAETPPQQGGVSAFTDRNSTKVFRFADLSRTDAGHTNTASVPPSPARLIPATHLFPAARRAAVRLQRACRPERSVKEVQRLRAFSPNSSCTGRTSTNRIDNQSYLLAGRARQNLQVDLAHAGIKSAI
jgi:hypothetical protein